MSQLMVVVPISVLLAASFFVIFALRKVEEKGLKIFGYVVAGLLWLSVLILFLGASNTAKNTSRMKYMMQQKMRAPYRSQMMQKGGMANMAIPEKRMLPKGRNPSGASERDGNRGFILKGE